MQSRSRVWLAAGGVFVLTGSAWAGTTHPYAECTLHPSESDTTAAKGAFQAGTVSFNEADYARAILYWEDAYRRDCTATLLLHHLGRAYEGSGNLEQAVVALRTFIERSPESPERGQIQRRIEVFEQKIAEEKQQAAAVSPVKNPATAPVVGVPSSQPSSGSAPAAPVPESSSTHRASLAWAPITLMAVGGVVTVVGAGVYFKAKSDLSNVEKVCPNHSSCSSPLQVQQGNSARARITTGTVMSFGGLAVAGAGVVWFLLDSRKSPSMALNIEAPAVSPWIGAGSAGLAWQGRF